MLRRPLEPGESLARLSLGMEDPERYEQLLAFLGFHLPTPVDQQTDAEGGIQFLGAICQKSWSC